MRWRVFFWGTIIGLMVIQLSQVSGLPAAIVIPLLPLATAIVVDQVTGSRKFWNGMLGGIGATLGTMILMRLALWLALPGDESFALRDEVIPMVGLPLVYGLVTGGLTVLAAKLRKRPSKTAFGSS